MLRLAKDRTVAESVKSSFRCAKIKLTVNRLEERRLLQSMYVIDLVRSDTKRKVPATEMRPVRPNSWDESRERTAKLAIARPNINDLKT